MIGLVGRLVDSNVVASSVVSFGALVLLDFLENETGLGTGMFSILVFEITRLAGVEVTMLGVVFSFSFDGSAGRVVTRTTTFLPDTVGCLVAGKLSSSSSESSLTDAVVVTIRGACVTLVDVILVLVPGCGCTGLPIGAFTPRGLCVVTRG